eukprot:Em0006g1149a
MAVNPAISLPSLHPMNYYNLSDVVRGTVSWAKQIVCCGEYDSISQNVKFGVLLVACKPKYRRNCILFNSGFSTSHY